MNKNATCALGAAVVMMILAAACDRREDSRPGPTAHSVQADDISKRRDVWREVAIARPERRGAEVVAMLPMGLTDPDSEVRSYAAAAAARIAFADQSGPKAFARNGRITDALLGLLDDPSSETRDSVLIAIGRGVEWTAEIEHVLIRRYKREPELAVRKRIMGLLSMQKLSSPESGKIIVGALSDQALRGAAAEAIFRMTIPPPQALPILAETIDLDDQALLPIYIKAIAHYGDKAYPYVNRLAELRDRLAEDSELKRLLDESIRKICGG